MLFSESMCFLKKTRNIPKPIMDENGQQSRSTWRSQSVADITLPPTRPARAYSNRLAPSPIKTPGATSPSWMHKVSLEKYSRSGSVASTASTSSSWMRKASLGNYSRSGSVASTASTSSKLSLPSLRRKKSELEPQPVTERRPSLWTHHTHGEPRTVFRNAGRDERGRLRLEYEEYPEVEW